MRMGHQEAADSLGTEKRFSILCGFLGTLKVNSALAKVRLRMIFELKNSYSEGAECTLLTYTIPLSCLKFSKY